MHDETCNLLMNFVSGMNDPFFVTLPDTFEEYYKKIEHTAQRNYRKAKRFGCYVKRIYEITDKIYSDLREIWTSKEIRQHRPAGKFYGVIGGEAHPVLESWPIKDYSIYKCPQHYLAMYGCFIKEKLVAYIEFVKSNTLIAVHSTLGHGNYLIKGVMKFLFLETIRMNIDKTKYFQYTNYQESGDRLWFLQDLNIIEHNNPKLIFAVSKGEI